MRVKCFTAAAILICSASLAESPLVLNISNAGVEINGVTYATRTALVEVLRKLKPTAVRFVPAKDTDYQTVSDALQAFQESGIKADIGLVGTVQSEK